MIYVNMVKVGEASGKLDVILLKIADQLENDYSLRTKIRSAMIYPSFILVVMIGLAVLLVTFVIPRLKPILESAQVKLPFLTSALIWSSDAFMKFWWLIIPAIIGGLIFARFYVKTTKEGTKFWDTYKLKIPIAGKIISNIYMARFSRTFSTLIAGGINVIEALEITANSVGNVLYKKDILDISKKVKNGESLSESFGKSRYASKILKKMIKVGESTGTLDTTIEKLAIFYEGEVDTAIENLSKTLEPLLIIVMGVAVAAVVSSVIMPLYDATRSIGSV